LVMLIVRRSVRKPVAGAGKKEWFNQLEDIEFVFPKEYNKILSPVFSQDFDFDAKSANGVLTFTLTPVIKAPGYKATALGAGRETVINILKEEYKENMNLEDTTKLAVKCLIKALEARQLPPRIKIAVIPTATKKMEMLSDEKIDDYTKELGSSK